MVFEFVLCVFVKRFFLVYFVYCIFSISFSIKFELIIIDLFLGVMAIIGNLSGSDAIRAYVLRGVFDVF